MHREGKFAPWRRAWAAGALVGAALMAAWGPSQAEPAAPAAATPPTAAAPLRLRVVGGLDGLNQYLRHEQPFWTKVLAAKTGGRVQAEIVPFDRAGIRGQEALRLMQLGVLPFGTALLGLSGNQNPELSASDLAGLNPDMASVRRAATAFRPLLEKTLRERFGIELLAIYAYPAQVVFCKRAFTGLADLRGRRVRTSSASQSDLIEALGGVPVMTSFADITTNLRSGAIDCAITGTMSGNTIGLHELTTHLHTMPVNWGLSVFAANTGAWNALPADVRALLREELPRLEAVIWAESEQETQDGLACNTGSAKCDPSRRGGMVAVPMTPQDEQIRKEVFAGTVLPRWIQRCGAVCARTWEQTLGPATGIQPPPR